MLEDLEKLFTVIDKGDPLLVEDNQKIKLCDSLKLGVRAIDGHVFCPSAVSLPFIDGHAQTVLMGVKGAMS